MVRVIAMVVYRWIERIDGERGWHIISYRLAERVKLWLLCHIIEDEKNGKNKRRQNENKISSGNRCHRGRRQQG